MTTCAATVSSCARRIERQQELLAWRSGDPIDGRQRLVHLEMQLRGTEREWAELQTMLGEPVSRPPVKLGGDAAGAAGALRSPRPGRPGRGT